MNRSRKDAERGPSFAKPSAAQNAISPKAQSGKRSTPLRDRREDIPAMIALFLREAAEPIDGTNKERRSYSNVEDALPLLCEFDYPGNIRTLRNLIDELTSYVTENKPISIELVQFALAKLRSQGGNYVSGISDSQLPSLITSIARLVAQSFRSQ